MIKYYCDVCSKEMLSGELIGKFEYTEHNLSKGSAGPEQRMVLMCNKCREKTRKYVDGLRDEKV